MQLSAGKNPRYVFLGLVFATAVPIATIATASVASAQADPYVQAGATVIQQRGCGGCHTIPGIAGAQGNIGPDLGPNGDIPPVSGRNPIATYPNGAVPNNSPDDLAAWIMDPQSLKPGTGMPTLGLSADDAAAAAAYLYAIQPDGSIAGATGSTGSTGSGG